MSLSEGFKRMAPGLLVVGALVATGCHEEPKQSIPGGIIRHEGAMPSPVSGGTSVKSQQALAAGQWDGPEQMYRATCAGCHDPAIGVGPPLFGRNLGTPYITTISRSGRNGMPGFFPSDFTDSEVQTLAAWIDAQPASAASPQAGGAH